MALSSLQIGQTSSLGANLRSHVKPISALQTSHGLLEASQRAELQRGTPLSTMYWLAAIAREKLQREADKDDHNLRLLVGHANLLDGVLPKLEVDEQAIEVHLVQFQDEAGVSDSPHKTTVAISPQKQRIAVILNEVDWSEYEDDIEPDEADDESESEDDPCIADGLSCSQNSERLDFGVPLYRTKIQTIVCIDQAFGEIEDKILVKGTPGHNIDLLRLEQTRDVLKPAESIEKIQL